METNQSDIPSFEELVADPDIAALLDFEPVVRKVKRGDGWTPALQRKFVAYVAHLGSRSQAADMVGREVAGASKLCRAEGGESFSRACDAALDLYHERSQEKAERNRGRAWGEPLRARWRRERLEAAPGMVRNEYDEWEEEEVSEERGEESRDSISKKLQRVRRLYLAEICSSAGKRAAFEILAGFPVDWEKAKRDEPQDDEPYRPLSIRTPDLILMGEAGYLGFMAHGRNRLDELRRELDEWRAEQGMDPIDWDDDPQSVRDRGAQPVPQTGAHRDDEDRHDDDDDDDEGADEE